MYKFDATEIEFTENEGVLSALKKLGDLKCTVSITRNDKKTEGNFTCKISDNDIVRSEIGKSPQFAARNAVNSYLDAVRKDKKRISTKGVSRNRDAKNLAKSIMD